MYETRTDLALGNLQRIIRILVGIIVNSDRNESRHTKKPTSISCNNIVALQLHHA
jgi:hypothetical protein